jgi:hypothetical protein
MKSEIKLEFPNVEVLDNIIRKSYFEEGYLGKLLTKNNFIEVTPELDDIFYTVVKGLNNATVKVTNSQIIDGSCRFIIEDIGEFPKIYPISMYCVIHDDNGKYTFY